MCVLNCLSEVQTLPEFINTCGLEGFRWKAPVLFSQPDHRWCLKQLNLSLTKIRKLNKEMTGLGDKRLHLSVSLFFLLKMKEEMTFKAFWL